MAICLQTFKPNSPLEGVYDLIYPPLDRKTEEEVACKNKQ